MSRWLAVARATLLEAIRHRILYLLLFFAAALILFSRSLSLLTVGQDAKIIKDVGLSAINLFGLLVVLFVGVGMLFREMERRTVQTTLSTPIARWEYLLGKFSGIAAAILLNAALMSLILFGLLWLRGEMTWSMVIACLMLMVELVFMTAIAVFYSSFSTPIFSALFTTATYLVGHLSWSLPMLEERMANGPGRVLVHAFYLVLPNLEYGDLRGAAAHGLEIPVERVLAAATYELSYAAVLLLLAMIAFRKRDLV